MLKIMPYSADWRLAAPKRQAIWIVSPPGLKDWPSSPPKSTCSRISMTMMSGCIRGLPWIRTICWVWIWATRMVGDILKWTGKWDHSNARIARRNSCKYILRLNIQRDRHFDMSSQQGQFWGVKSENRFFFLREDLQLISVAITTAPHRCVTRWSCTWLNMTCESWDKANQIKIQVFKTNLIFTFVPEGLEPLPNGGSDIWDNFYWSWTH